MSNKKHPAKLLFTFATEKECPKSFFKEYNIPCLTIKGIQSGILASISNSLPYIAIITGVGPQKSATAATLIAQHFNPESIINIGSCGTRNERLLHQWIRPTYCQDRTKTIQLHEGIPFPYPEHNTIQTLYTTDTPSCGPETAEILDMEAAPQAALFSEKDIPFFTLKWATDKIGDNTDTQYCASMPNYLEAVKACFQWIIPETPKTSVIIPTYNRAEVLKRAIQSVKNQSFQAHEIIVIDDGSTDNTREVVEMLKHNTPALHYRFQPNQGVSSARNFGIQNSSGDWIALLDSDDEWHKKKLETQYNYLNEFCHYTCLQSNENWIRNNKIVHQKKHHQKQAGWIFDSCVDRCIISPSTVLIKKSLFNTIGLFDPQLPACEDYALWLKLGYLYPVGLTNAPLTNKYGGHDDQLSNEPGLDIYRLQALSNFLNTKRPKKTTQKTIQKIIEKAKILVNGRLKRN